MEFNTLQFLIFFPVVTIMYFAMPKAFKKPWLLVCSYYFYMCWNAAYAILIFISTISTYLCSYFIELAKTQRGRKIALVLNLVVNLSILFFYKYFNFFSTTIATAIGGLGFEMSPLLIDTKIFMLPVGISFYTFQALGYSIDVYRKTIPHEKSFLNYALFVSFFPQLVAGPIERAKNFLPQLQKPTYFDYTRVCTGLRLMLWGFFQKVVISEGAELFIAKIFASPQHYTGHTLVVSTIIFAFRIYCDFAGYTNIAIGAAKVLGFDLMRNFNRPYLATSISDFWRRWHISLSTWLKDYVYIPLGGSRKGKVRHCINLVITFLLSGLWHGAELSFVVWGLLHGLASAVQAAFRKPVEFISEKLYLKKIRILTTPIKILFTFTFVCFCWIFFRANNMEDAIIICKEIFTTVPANLFSAEMWADALYSIGFINLANPFFSIGSLAIKSGTSLLACIVFMFFIELFENKTNISEVLEKRFFLIKWAFCIILLAAILFWGVYQASSFYYFQF